MSESVQIVSTDAGHHVRIRGANGEPIAATEVHPDIRDAENAVHVIARAFGVTLTQFDRDRVAFFDGTVSGHVTGAWVRVPVEYVDERTSPSALED